MKQQKSILIYLLGLDPLLRAHPAHLDLLKGHLSSCTLALV
jgi:hypothetical protein